jgi:hypothetical protein
MCLLTDNDDAGGDEHEDGGDAKGQGIAGVVAKALNVLYKGIEII